MGSNDGRTRALLYGVIPLLLLFPSPRAVAQSDQSWTAPVVISDTLTPLEVGLGNPGVDRLQVMALWSDGSANQLSCFLVEDPYEPVVSQQSIVAAGTLFGLSHGVQRLPGGDGAMSYIDDGALQVITATAGSPCSWMGGAAVITPTVYGSSELRLVGGSPVLAGYNFDDFKVDLYTPTSTIGVESRSARDPVIRFATNLAPYREIQADSGIAGAINGGTRVGLSTDGGTDCVWATTPVITDTVESFVDCANPSLRIPFDRDVFPAGMIRESVGQGIGGFHWFAYAHEGSGQVRLARLDPSSSSVISFTVGPAPTQAGFYGIGMAPGTSPGTLRVVWPGHDVEIDVSTGISGTVAAYPLTQEGPVSLLPFSSSQFTHTLATAGPGSLLFSVFPAQASVSVLEIPALDRWGLLALSLLLVLVALGLLRGLGGPV